LRGNRGAVNTRAIRQSIPGVSAEFMAGYKAAADQDRVNAGASIGGSLWGFAGGAKGAQLRLTQYTRALQGLPLPTTVTRIPLFGGVETVRNAITRVAVNREQRTQKTKDQRTETTNSGSTGNNAVAASARTASRNKVTGQAQRGADAVRRAGSVDGAQPNTSGNGSSGARPVVGERLSTAAEKLVNGRWVRTAPVAGASTSNQANSGSTLTGADAGAASLQEAARGIAGQFRKVGDAVTRIINAPQNPNLIPSQSAGSSQGYRDPIVTVDGAPFNPAQRPEVATQGLAGTGTGVNMGTGGSFAPLPIERPIPWNIPATGIAAGRPYGETAQIVAGIPTPLEAERQRAKISEQQAINNQALVDQMPQDGFGNPIAAGKGPYNVGDTRSSGDRVAQQRRDSKQDAAQRKRDAEQKKADAIAATAARQAEAKKRQVETTSLLRNLVPDERLVLAAKHPHQAPEASRLLEPLRRLDSNLGDLVKLLKQPVNVPELHGNDYLINLGPTDGKRGARPQVAVVAQDGKGGYVAYKATFNTQGNLDLPVGVDRVAPAKGVSTAPSGSAGPAGSINSAPNAGGQSGAGRTSDAQGVVADTGGTGGNGGINKPRKKTGGTADGGDGANNSGTPQDGAGAAGGADRAGASQLAPQRPGNYDFKQVSPRVLSEFLREMERFDPSVQFTADQILEKALVALKALGTDTLSTSEMAAIVGFSNDVTDMQLGGEHALYFDRVHQGNVHPLTIDYAKKFNPSQEPHEIHFFFGGFFQVPTRDTGNSQPGAGGEGNILAMLTGAIPPTDGEQGLFGQSKSERRKRLKTSLLEQVQSSKQSNAANYFSFNDLQNANAAEIKAFIIEKVVRGGHLANPFFGDRLKPLLRDLQNAGPGSFQRQHAIKQLNAFYAHSERLVKRPPSLRAITAELQLYEAILLYGERTGWIQRGNVAPTGQQALFNFSEFRKFLNQSQTNGELVTPNEVAGWLKRAGLSYRD
jgi:hypothetical protein